MKVALVLTGLLRCFEQAYPSFKKYVIDRYDTDVYLDIWSEVGYYSGKGYLPEQNGFIQTAKNDRGFHNSGELVDANKLIRLYKPVSLIIDDYSQFEAMFDKRAGQFPKAFTRPKNTIAQAYKIYSGISQCFVNRSNAQYDLVVRARPDLVLEQDPGLFALNKFYTLPSRNKEGKGTGDSLQIGTLSDMFQFSQMYRHLEELYNEVGYSCPHMFNENWIKHMGLDWKELRVGAHVAHSPKGLYQEPE